MDRGDLGLFAKPEGALDPNPAPSGFSIIVWPSEASASEQKDVERFMSLTGITT